MWPVAGSTYYLMGILGDLDAPHEWYVDAAAKKVYLWAPDGGVPSNVEVKKRHTAFNLNDKSYIHLAGLRVFAANIPMNNAHHNVLDGLEVLYPYFSNFSQGTSIPHQLTGGINVAGTYNEIKNSAIAWGGDAGSIGGDGAWAPYNQPILSTEDGVPLSVQLGNRVEQARHHLDKGRSAQAAKQLEDFIKYLTNPAQADAEFSSRRGRKRRGKEKQACRSKTIG